ncbi:type II toxin-antitoxin system Phd/YefM family antitoxin [Nitratifractor sp.]|uniref:type II toxin-antitoxin system Phd/YefM family antitoxin n=1 Tax=Nitratifractor sp. TaxID=2268144 RepID=UPI0025E46714|nr:type II toxin-antitoxin system Phd/YefM family antitoxin [Nitratifractor sp.]
MSKVIPVSQARANIYKLIDETAESHEPVIITGKRHNAVMLSLEDWKAIEETLYLNAIPGLVESITEAKNSPDEEFSEDLDW